MLAAQYRTYGDPSVLEIADRPEPHAGPGSVRVRVLAVSVNPIDRLLRAGVLAEVMPLSLPAIPGRDAVGIIDEIGDGVSDVAVGDKVFGLGGISDTTAEYAVLTAWAPVPHTWSDAQAAAAGLASVTALNALDTLGPLSGTTLLIDGAAGAVGGAAASFATAAGARVVGTASETNHERLRALNVTPVTYGAGLIERVLGAAPVGIDVAIDASGAGSLPQLIELVGDPHRVVTVADHQRAQHLGVRTANADNDSTLLRRAAAHADTGSYTPHVSDILPFTDIARAHTETATSSGKFVLRVAIDR